MLRKLFQTSFCFIILLESSKRFYAAQTCHFDCWKTTKNTTPRQTSFWTGREERFEYSLAVYSLVFLPFCLYYLSICLCLPFCLCYLSLFAFLSILSRVGHRLLLRSEGIVLLHSFKARNVLLHFF